VRHLLPPSLPSIPPTTPPSLATHAQVNSYTDAIKLDTKNHVLYSNRANAYTRLESFKEALRDADECVKLEGDWAKGHARRGAALAGLLQHDEAREAYSRAVRRRLFRLGSAPGGEGWVGRVGWGGVGGEGGRAGEGWQGWEGRGAERAARGVRPLQRLSRPLGRRSSTSATSRGSPRWRTSSASWARRPPPSRARGWGAARRGRRAARRWG